ncbi:uncharacterized protein KD926_000829 [Aspergillus affinis]|uniref:uncharacterized protein n=1 Tax=Aspergillus affinis TaxID=1070780 RepID=UPI0022FE2896|nr:uncharacterized protein KD926_000829 [Aspergillus affinis]KAI9037112.1 hypothetical protein KD926_000829 [Aspergillus affinis]
MEVCLNDSQPQEINTQHPPTVGDQTSCASLGVEAFGFDDILQLQDLPSPGGEDHPSICDDLGPESQYPLDFDLGDPKLACIASQHSHVGNTGSSSLAGEWCDATIDPAILDDYRSADVEQSPPRRKETSRAVAPPRSSDKNVRGNNIRTSSQRPKPMHQSDDPSERFR